MNVFVKAVSTILSIFLTSRNFEMAYEAHRRCSHSCYMYAKNCNPSVDDQCSLNCNGQTCVQSCNGGNCDLECDGPHCKQNCDNKNGECTLKCRGEKCYQTCNGDRCSLQCNGKHCEQTCNEGTCSLECNRKDCKQKCYRHCNLECHGQSCEQDCRQALYSCQLQCPVLSSGSICQQNCQYKETLCTKRSIATTKAPTTFSKLYISRTGSPVPETTLLSSLLVSSSRIIAPSSTETTSEITTSLMSQSSSASLSPLVSASSKSLSSTPPVTPSETVSTPSPSSSSSSPSSSSSVLLASASLKPSSIATMPVIATSVPSKASSTTASKEAIAKSQNISRTEELVIKFIYGLNRTDVQQDTSLQAVVNLLHNTTEQLRNISHNDVQQGFITEQERKGFIFKVVTAFEGFSLKYGRSHLNESMPHLTNAYSKLVLHIQRVFGRAASNFHLEGPEKNNFITIPSSNFHNSDSVLVGIVYKDLHELLKSRTSINDATKNSRSIATIIMTATMDPRPDKLQQNVVLKFKNLKVDVGERFCVFWSGYSDKNPDGWSGEGCHVVRSKSSSGQTECSCNHMTHFAVLFYHDSLKITKTDEKILTILTYIGLALSIIGIILTIISYLYFTDVHQPLSQIRISLASSLGVGQVVFLAGINATGNTVVCVSVAALMQYFLMAAFCWMLVEGIYLYLFVVKVYNINNKMAIYHVMSWCFPGVMVAISLSIAAGIGGIQSFVSDKYCWLSSDNNLIWIFVSFVVIIEVVNLSILARVIKEMATMQAEDKQIQQIKLGIKACAVLIPLLGVTWLFGLLSPLHKAFVYIFTILNSAQGFLIFLLHCLRNSQIKERFRRRINTIFPRANDENHAKKTSQFNGSDVGAMKKIEVQPCSNSVFELNQQ